MAFILKGLGTEQFTFSPSFHYIIFKRQVFNTLGLTPTLYQYNLDFGDVYFYLYWKKKKQNHFLLVAALKDEKKKDCELL